MVNILFAHSTKVFKHIITGIAAIDDMVRGKERRILKGDVREPCFFLRPPNRAATAG